MDENNLSKADFHRRSDLETATKFVSRMNEEFGNAVVVQNVSTRQRYLLKEKTFADRFSFLEELNRVKRRQQLQHANIQRLFDYSTLTKIDTADQCFRLRLFFEHFPSNLSRELKSRGQSGSGFALEELTYLIYDMVSACAFLQKQNVNHGDLNPDNILRSDDGHFVLGEKLRAKSAFPQNLIDRYIRGEKLYISPELFSMIRSRNSEAINRMDNYVNDVFILGLCILEAGIGADPTVIFKRGAPAVDSGRLKEMRQAFADRFGADSLPNLVLGKMLEVDPKKRPDFAVLKSALPPYQDVILFFQGTRPTPSHSTTDLSVSQRFSKAPLTESLLSQHSITERSPYEPGEGRKKSIFGDDRQSSLAQSGLLVSNKQLQASNYFDGSAQNIPLTGYRIPESMTSESVIRQSQPFPRRTSNVASFQDRQSLPNVFFQSSHHNGATHDFAPALTEDRGAFKKRPVQATSFVEQIQSAHKPTANGGFFDLPQHHQPLPPQVRSGSSNLGPAPRHTTLQQPSDFRPQLYQGSAPHQAPSFNPQPAVDRYGQLASARPYNPLMTTAPRIKSTTVLPEGRPPASTTPDRQRPILPREWGTPNAQPKINSQPNMQPKPSLPKPKESGKSTFTIF